MTKKIKLGNVILRNNKNLKDGSLLLIECEDFKANNITFENNYSMTKNAGLYMKKSRFI